MTEFEDKAVLFVGDAHAPQVEASVERLLKARGLDRLRLDAFKMSHHGSARNNSTALLELLDCPRYLISSDGLRRASRPSVIRVARSGDRTQPVWVRHVHKDVHRICQCAALLRTPGAEKPAVASSNTATQS